MQKFNRNFLSKRLLKWFSEHGRKDLPWQKKINAYRVWVSEIMLQQTQVSTVIPYYIRFMKKFPTVKSLAKAQQDDVLHHWTGLGYYARARNLHKTAKIICDNYQGKFPKDIDSLIELPGIGRSTAGAISAIAFQSPTSILDGNVKRVLCRFHAVEGWPEQTDVKKKLWEIADHYTPQEQTGDYTQAIMDLGATICTRTQAKCHLCPLVDKCEAYRQARTTELPTRKAQRRIPTRATQLLMIKNSKDEWLLEKRPPVGIWGGLWCFPECSHDEDISVLCSDKLGVHIKEMEKWNSFRHTFSHYHLDITPVELVMKKLSKRRVAMPQYFWYKTDSALKLGLSAPMKRLLLRLAETEPAEGE